MQRYNKKKDRYNYSPANGNIFPLRRKTAEPHSTFATVNKNKVVKGGLLPSYRVPMLLEHGPV